MFKQGKMMEQEKQKKINLFWALQQRGRSFGRESWFVCSRAPLPGSADGAAMTRRLLISYLILPLNPQRENQPLARWFLYFFLLLYLYLLVFFLLLLFSPIILVVSLYSVFDLNSRVRLLLRVLRCSKFLFANTPKISHQHFCAE